MNDVVKDLLEWVLSIWQKAFETAMTVVTVSPKAFMGGAVWPVITGINDLLQGVANALIVLFFALESVRTGLNFQDMKRLETVTRTLVYFVIAKLLVTYSLPVLTGIFEISLGIVGRISEGAGAFGATGGLDPSVAAAVDEMTGGGDFVGSLLLILVSVIGALIIAALSISILITVYGRFFRIYLYTAVAPIPLASFVGETTSATAKAFLRSYVGVCMEGAIIVLAFVVYSAYLKSPDFELFGGSGWRVVFGFILKTVLGMFILNMTIKASDRLVKDMFAL